MGPPVSTFTCRQRGPGIKDPLVDPLILYGLYNRFIEVLNKGYGKTGDSHLLRPPVVIGLDLRVEL